MTWKRTYESCACLGNFPPINKQRKRHACLFYSRLDCMLKEINFTLRLSSFFLCHQKKSCLFSFFTSVHTLKWRKQAKTKWKETIFKTVQAHKLFSASTYFFYLLPTVLSRTKEMKMKKFSIRRFMLRTYGNSVGVGNGNNPRALQESFAELSTNQAILANERNKV